MIDNAILNHDGESQNNEGGTTWIGWNPPVAGWHCLDTDGSVASSQHYAGHGGLLQGDSGNWVASFSKNLGLCSVEETELWALILGLQLAWNNNICLLVAEINSKVVFDCLSGPINCLHKHSALIWNCHSLLQRN